VAHHQGSSQAPSLLHSYHAGPSRVCIHLHGDQHGIYLHRSHTHRLHAHAAHRVPTARADRPPCRLDTGMRPSCIHSERFSFHKARSSSRRHCYLDIFGIKSTSNSLTRSNKVCSAVGDEKSESPGLDPRRSSCRHPETDGATTALHCISEDRSLMAAPAGSRVYRYPKAIQHGGDEGPWSRSFSPNHCTLRHEMIKPWIRLALKPITRRFQTTPHLSGACQTFDRG
jgi:hypothetical protein